MKTTWVVIAALLFPLAAAAQDTVLVSPKGPSDPLADRMVRDAVAIYNAPSTTRARGPYTIQRTETFGGDVAVLDGPVRVRGEVRGTLVAINADVDLDATAVVDGDVIIVGGGLSQNVHADIHGTIRVRSTGVRVALVGDSLIVTGDIPPRRHVTVWPRTYRAYHRGWGRTGIILNTNPTYNRVEGLPLNGGLRIAWGGTSSSGQIEAFGIFRTAGDFNFNRQDMGYMARGRLRFGWNALELGGSAYDHVVAVPSWQLENDEIGLGTFLWHRDYQDYYLARGASAHVTLRPADGLALTGEYRREEQGSILARDPWTLFRGAEAWRANPAVDQGTYTLLTGRLEFDSRNAGYWAGSGWLLRAEWEHGSSDSIVPVVLPSSVRPSLTVGGSLTYDWASVDLRRYQAIGGSGVLALRALAAGDPGRGGDGPLPMQRRVAAGGPGLMPGYGFRQFACNGSVTDPADRALCDRMVVLQAEYRGGFPALRFGDHDWDDRAARSREWDPGDFDWDVDWFEGPQFVLLADAGTAWLHPNDPGPLHVDLGAGLEFGSVGLYAAHAIEQGTSLRWSLRIHRRF